MNDNNNKANFTVEISSIILGIIWAAVVFVNALDGEFYADGPSNNGLGRVYLRSIEPTEFWNQVIGYMTIGLAVAGAGLILIFLQKQDR